MLRKVKRLFFGAFVVVSLLGTTTAHATDIPTLTWEKGAHEQITLGGNNGGGSWKLYLVGPGNTVLDFHSSKIKNSSFYKYDVALPNYLTSGNYEILVSQVASGTTLAVVGRTVVGHVKVIDQSTYDFKKDSKFGWLVIGLLAFLIPIAFNISKPSSSTLKLIGLVLPKSMNYVGLALGLGLGAFSVHVGELTPQSIYIPLVGLVFAFLNFRFALFTSLGFILVDFAFGKVSTFQHAAGILAFALSWLAPVLLTSVVSAHTTERFVKKSDQIKRLLVTSFSLAFIGASLPIFSRAVLGLHTSSITIGVWAVGIAVLSGISFFMSTNGFETSSAEISISRFRNTGTQRFVLALISGFILYILTRSVLAWIALTVLLLVIPFVGQSKIGPTSTSGLVRYQFEILILISYTSGLAATMILKAFNSTPITSNLCVVVFSCVPFIYTLLTEKSEVFA